MLRWVVSAVVALLLVAAVAPSSQGRNAGKAVRLGGAPLQLLAGRGSLWVLTCDRGCKGEARHSTGRIIRIDPRTARVVASATIPRPNNMAIGPLGLYATDFERVTIRWIDFRTLRVVRAFKLSLPFRFSPRDNAFLPEAAAVGQGALWVVSDRGRSFAPIRGCAAPLRVCACPPTPLATRLEEWLRTRAAFGWQRAWLVSIA
jgi:hypothetical protein